ncbi:unnamed protein product [Lathyrus sativus]|nr:unnamed protein product [Lathyrus sativus]
MSLLWMSDEHRGTQSNIRASVRFPLLFYVVIFIIVVFTIISFFFQTNARFRVHYHAYIQATAGIIPYLEIAGFANIAKINSLKIESSLIVALLEKWRPEAHTFHFPTGKCTITLEDVNMLLSLRVNGKAINCPTGVTNDVYMENLGVEPTAADKSRGSVRIIWLENLYEVLKNNSATTQEHTILQAKIYILLVIATILFPDNSQNILHSSWIPFVGDLEKCNTFSWGSACLAKLYREMCKAAVRDVRSMSSCVLLLTTWTFTRIPLVAPVSTLQLSFPYA